MRADIHYGREQYASLKGRIEMSETSYLQIGISSLRHTAGPYRSASSDVNALLPISRHFATTGTGDGAGIVAAAEMR
jgi:hypothetical protein